MYIYTRIHTLQIYIYSILYILYIYVYLHYIIFIDACTLVYASHSLLYLRVQKTRIRKLKKKKNAIHDRLIYCKRFRWR